MYKIYIVEDDEIIAKVLAAELENWGFETARAMDFSNVAEEFARVSPHLVLLDLSLPFRSGFYWCAEIRRRSTVPVIFISSAADNMSMVTALHQGADDFIAKPFDLNVLVAKVQALLRRSYDFAGAAEADTGIIECGGIRLDINTMALFTGDNKIELSRNEFRILQVLMENNNKVVSRSDIMRKLWDDENFIDENTLTVNINRLRKKLEQAGLTELILTKKGEGYWIPSGL
jgi:DNA-binding response OmpR family regulator